ncbi:uncharacterized protein IL334_001955 [Kwoniella shivajii]|uniref:Structure-specific endonuclease subunit SLX4 n=1 Tax=Kwoniella shivajii TaxID=564305 RepID=A0ABZ1CV02_9TREE|nr:hypothetical protein IL334_001955 [Kwoniella shivajii]
MEIYTIPSSSPEDNWGDEALLSWDGEDDAEVVSVSSVAPSEAGLDREEDDEEDWGRDAYLEWAYEGGDDAVSTNDDMSEDENALGEDMEDEDEDEDDEDDDSGKLLQLESPAQLVSRGMPDYSTWELKKLQRLIVGYGYRTSNDRKSLEKLAIDCWRSINPPSSPIITSTSLTPAKNTNSKRPIERDSSVSSADVPLAQVKDTKKQKGKSKETALNIVDSQDSPHGANRAKSSKGKRTIRGKVDEKDKDNGVAKSGKVDLSKRFYDMIMNDQELWLRILRYEPISFDELVSKSIASGIDKESRSWKKDLKKYLDLQSISFFTEDPTGGQRRRH